MGNFTWTLILVFHELTTTHKNVFRHFAVSGRILWVSCVSYVDLQQWFKPVDTLPQLKGPLCITISPNTIRNVNEEVHKVGTPSRSSRGAYVKVPSEQQAKYCNTCPCMAMQKLFADFQRVGLCYQGERCLLVEGKIPDGNSAEVRSRRYWSLNEEPVFQEQGWPLQLGERCTWR